LCGKCAGGADKKVVELLKSYEKDEKDEEKKGGDPK